MGRPKSKKASQPAVETQADDVTTAPVIQEDDLDAVLAEINGDLQAPVTVVAEPEPEAALEVEEDDVEAALRALANTQAAPTADPAEPAAPKTSRIKAVQAKFREFKDVAQISEGDLKANLAALNAKKVNEKVQNVIQAIESGKKLSRYTKDAISLLKTAGRVSGKSLVEDFRNKGLSDGTARAQAQQMTALFKTLGIAVLDPNAKGELVMHDAGLVQELLAA